MDSSKLISDLAAALSGSDPAAAFDAARAVLHGAGLDEVDPNAPRWASIESAEHQLSFRTRGAQPEPDALSTLTNMLRAGFARAQEYQFARLARERMDMLSAASFEGILISVDGSVIDVNQRLCEMLDYSHEQLLGDFILRHCIAAEDLPIVRHRLSDRIEGEYVVTGLRRDGGRFRAELHSKQGALGDRPIRVSAVRDVTERERTSALLREGEMRLRHVLEAAFDIVVTSKDGIVVDAVGKLDAFFGLLPDEVVGRPILDFIAPNAQAQVAQILSEQRVGTYETDTLDVRGERIPVSVLGVKSTWNGEPVRVAAVRDLRETQRKERERQRLEQHVARAQRLDSLGVLAGGIAHDFNNLLVGVLGGAEILMRRLEDAGDRGIAENIRASGQRAANLTKQMLAYAGRGGLRAREAVDVSLLCDELRELFEATLSKKARVDLELDPRCVTLGERATLMQVLLNLLTNASDALDNRAGTIRVSTRRLRDPSSICQHPLGAPIGPGDWIAVQVTDSGIGMDEATQRRIFEPFFSTKPLGHGLGLASCLGIVTAHGGAIQVDSELGKGTAITVLLPATDTPAPVRSEPQPVTPRACRVLVIDDEPMVRSHARRMLEQNGYTVEVAPDGRSGLAALERQMPDVLLLDLTMPDIDGVEIVKRLRALGSTLPIVLCSGNLAIATDSGLSLDMVQGTLPKPFSIEELIGAIERARDAHCQ